MVTFTGRGIDLLGMTQVAVTLRAYAKQVDRHGAVMLHFSLRPLQAMRWAKQCCALNSVPWTARARDYHAGANCLQQCIDKLAADMHRTGEYDVSVKGN